MLEPTELCWCGHSWKAHGFTYKLRLGEVYCLSCYWHRYPYKTKAGSDEDFHSFETERDLLSREPA